MTLKHRLTILFAAGAVALAATTWAAEPDKAQLQRGRYLLTIGGCNDCHTPNYPESGGMTPESDRFTGSPIGFQGPWGTTYPVNLRLLVQRLSEAEFLKRARTPMRPPMPWFNLRDMHSEDVKAIYAYLRYLGPKGNPAPSFAAPGKAVNTPYFVFVPTNLPKQAAR